MTGVVELLSRLVAVDSVNPALAAGIPTVLFGPSGEVAHAVEEWVSIADTETVARTLVATAQGLCA